MIVAPTGQHRSLAGDHDFTSRLHRKRTPTRVAEDLYAALMDARYEGDLDSGDDGWARRQRLCEELANLLAAGATVEMGWKETIPEEAREYFTCYMALHPLPTAHEQGQEAPEAG